MGSLRYDYLLHSSVRATEDWGVAPDRFQFKEASGKGEAWLVQEHAKYAQLPNLDDDQLARFKKVNYALAVAEMNRMASECVSRPYVVQISRTEQCNLSCVYCRPTPTHHSNRVLDFNVWRRALPVLLRPALEFMPFCWGEPLMAPDFDVCCEYATRYRTDVSFVTNLHYLNEQLAEIFARCVSRALVSIDSADSDEFARLRKGGSIRKLTGNLRMLESAADRIGRRTWLGIEAVALASNLEGLPQLIRWAGDQGLRGIVVRLAVIRENVAFLGKTEQIELNSPAYRRVLERCRYECDRLGLVLNMADPDHCLGSEQMCPCPWHHVYLSASGKLSKCSFSHQAVLGDAPQGDDTQYWNADEFVRTRQSWTPTFRCPECVSLDFIGRAEVSQVRGY